MAVQITDLRKPGTYLNEQESFPVITGASLDMAAMVVETRRGPTNATRVDSWPSFNRRFGGGAQRPQGYYGDATSPFSVKAYFDNGGVNLMLARVVCDDAVKASVTVKGMDGILDTLKIDAIDYGAYGNDLSISSLRYQIATTGTIATGATSVAVSSVVNVQLGDYLIISDGITTIRQYVLAIVASTNTVYFRGTAHATIATAATVKCFTSHLAATVITEALDNTDTSVLLLDATGIEVGSLVLIDVYDAAPGWEQIEVLVTAKSANRITFDAVSLSVSIASGALAVSQETDISIYDANAQVETWPGLCMQSTHETQYVELVSGEANPSIWIALTDMESAATKLVERIPALEDEPLIGGYGGADALTDTEWIGSATTPKSGIHAFDEVDIDSVSVPGVGTQAVVRALGLYTKTRKDIQGGIISGTLADDTPEELLIFKNHTINYPTSYLSMYAGWLFIRDPRKPKTKQSGIWVPPEGFVQGQWSWFARNRGIHHTPANEPLAGDILKLSMSLTNANEGDLATLNHNHINVIRTFSGRGTVIYGGRTMAALKNGYHYVCNRRMMTRAEKSILDYLEWFAFKPNHSSYRDQCKAGIDRFIKTLYDNKQLDGDSLSEAGFCQCDGENNPKNLRDLGYWFVDAGINLIPPGEFVILNMSMFKGTVSLVESSAI